MTENTTRTAAEAFYKASAERDIARCIALIDDDVDWFVQGPVDIFSFLGHRRGKAAVLQGYRDMAQRLEFIGYQVEKLLVDGDHAAALIRLSSIVRATGNVMAIRTSQFSRFASGKIVEMHAVVDTFDMVEQTLGRPLSLVPDDRELTLA